MSKNKMQSYNILSACQKARLGILELIQSGEIPSGHRIDQRAIAKQLELTTAPIREALSSLETEGLLQREPGLGVFCKAYTVNQVEEAVEIRGILMGLAAKRAAARITNTQKKKLLEIAQKLSHPKNYSDDNEHLQAHIDFCSYIADISASEQLIQLLERNFIIQQILSNISADIWPVNIFDHIKIAQAICAGDPIQAENTLKEHISAFFQKKFQELRLKYGSGSINSSSGK